MAGVISRYARAFADVVLEAKLDVSAVQAQLASIVDVYENSDDLRRVWEAPSIPATQKHALLDAILARLGTVPRQLRNFIAVLIDHGRIVSLPLIARQFRAELNQRLGIVEAEVVSARDLGEAARAALVAQLTQKLGKQVTASYSVDSSLLGGATVRVGSTVYDGSVRGQLRRLRQELASES